MEILEYIREDGSNPYKSWFDSLGKNYTRNTISGKTRQIMNITRDYKQTISERVNKDSAFMAAMLDEAITVFLNGEPEVARLVLRDLVNATVGFEALALELEKPSKSLHRMLSARGNPTMDNLTKIIGVLRKQLGLEIEVHTTPSRAA